uniref:Uncharacterized protein n=1 Tax=Arundo donax TaxID=35708 RepID=A0A0A9C8S9_ARUDO
MAVWDFLKGDSSARMFNPSNALLLDATSKHNLRNIKIQHLQHKKLTSATLTEGPKWRLGW